MKWLLVLLVVLAGVWWLRNMGRGERFRTSSRPPQTTPDPAPHTMTQCLHCGLHLPREDAVQGQQGDYCSAAHRQQREG
jgi:uncharacterized protein